MISWNDFEKVDMRVGTILSVHPLENAIKPAFRLEIDFGPLGVKKSSAQLTKLYTPHDLLGKQVIAVVNFPSKKIAGFVSDVLVLGVYNENNHVVLLKPDRLVANGHKIG
ncbi:tRNA-binding protein [Flavihumibacter profundi]|uniref:tRNA-binding protein n=1 Tax=Flavihumibacter profundi TaxID=2716883 RepID=UPI001CC4465D|nr:tRNA-binding protein [Flavihumibacter profundi]MBZ5856256.1 tRNA-binding protein [Flavihumibacter profundi]